MTIDQQLAKALKIAFQAHQDQPNMDKKPYLYHPMRLADRAATEDERIVALLHDAVEDSGATLDSLRAGGFPEHIVTAIDHLTKREGEAYDAFIERVLLDPLATKVKLLDIEDNLNMAQLPEAGVPNLEQAAAYQKARKQILAKIAEQEKPRG